MKFGSCSICPLLGLFLPPRWIVSQLVCPFLPPRWLAGWLAGWSVCWFLGLFLPPQWLISWLVCSLFSLFLPLRCQVSSLVCLLLDLFLPLSRSVFLFRTLFLLYCYPFLGLILPGSLIGQLVGLSVPRTFSAQLADWSAGPSVQSPASFCWSFCRSHFFPVKSRPFLH